MLRDKCVCVGGLRDFREGGNIARRARKKTALTRDQAGPYLTDDVRVLRVLSRKLFKGELEKKWPKPEQPNDWDMWMRMESNKKGRECIIPDISRTYHFGAKGLNVGSFMQTIYFKKHSLNKERNVKLDVDKMYKDNYEKEMFRLIG